MSKWLISWKGVRVTCLGVCGAYDRQPVEHVEIIDMHPAQYVADIVLNLRRFYEQPGNKFDFCEELTAVYSAYQIRNGMLTDEQEAALR